MGISGFSHTTAETRAQRSRDRWKLTRSAADVNAADGFFAADSGHSRFDNLDSAIDQGLRALVKLIRRNGNLPVAEREQNFSGVRIQSFLGDPAHFQYPVRIRQTCRLGHFEKNRIEIVSAQFADA